MKFLTLLLPLTIAVSLAACALSNRQSQVVPSQQPLDAATTDVRVMQVTSENWKFTPNVITAKKGERVQLQVTGISGTHGFAVPDLGINVPVAPGQTVVIDLPTDSVGSHRFFCSIPCGPGHSDMTGQIIIEP